MSRAWLVELLHSAAAGPVVRAVVVQADGSTPREVGASIVVTAAGSTGTIGGGALEYSVIARARRMLAQSADEPWLRDVVRYHLGPALNQCCGGVVSVLLERIGAAEKASFEAISDNCTELVRPLTSGRPMSVLSAKRNGASLEMRGGELMFSEPLVLVAMPLIIYGAGHVGRALVRVLEDLPFDVTWADVDQERFPLQVPKALFVCIADLPTLARGAADGALHLVMTHSHALDEDIVRAVLEVGTFSYLGLIGSKTKAARFRQRLQRDGLSEADIGRLHCPIGLTGLSGKSPTVIAVSVAADILLRQQRQWA
jgi:xanthine dehydrogenase accessory factor